MYAAAGGASLASRQARKKQRQTKTSERLQALKTQQQVEKLQPHHFPNYTDVPAPRLSRVERGTLKPPTPSHTERRHSTSHQQPRGGRLKESPSICIPVHHSHPHHGSAMPLTPSTLVQRHSLHPSPSIQSVQSTLPQIVVPLDDDGKIERRCSFVRQVEEMEKNHEGGVLDRCNHICNFEIKEKLLDNQSYFMDYERDVFGSLDYPFSECSQGRAAWQERERGRRCSLSEQERQHRLKQTEAHHRWMKKNRIHDSNLYGSDSEDDIFNVYHQSAAANALLYVGLGTTAIGSVIFFVGTGEKGFKTLELRLIGPTLVACGLLCCLIRILLCALPSTCLKKRHKTRLKDAVCPHSSSRYPLAPNIRNDHMSSNKHEKHKKKVSIVPPNHSLPSTSTSEFKDFPQSNPKTTLQELPIPEIHLQESVSAASLNDSVIELQNLDLTFDIESLSSNGEDSVTVIDTHAPSSGAANKLQRTRAPVNATNIPESCSNETTLSVVIERNDNSESSDISEKRNSTLHEFKITNEKLTEKTNNPKTKSKTHSGIVLSPLDLGQ